MNPLLSLFTGGNDSAPMIPAQPPMATNADPIAAIFNGGDGEGILAPGGASLRPAWQQELMRMVDPDRERSRNIGRSLAAAAQALASTPGNALQGLAAGAGAGAQQWQTGQDAIQDRRMTVLKALFEDQSSQRKDHLANEKLLYERGRDAKTDARADKVADSLVSYRNRQAETARRKAEADGRKIDLQIGKTGSGLTFAQRRMANDSVIKAVNDFREVVFKNAITAEEKIFAENQAAEYEASMLERYGLDRAGNFSRSVTPLVHDVAPPEYDDGLATTGDGTVFDTPVPRPDIPLTPAAPGKGDLNWNWQGAAQSGAQPQQGTPDKPFTPMSIEDLNAIPKGAIYLNPADGRPYVKN